MQGTRLQWPGFPRRRRANELPAGVEMVKLAQGVLVVRDLSCADSATHDDRIGRDRICEHRLRAHRQSVIGTGSRRAVIRAQS